MSNIVKENCNNYDNYIQEDEIDLKELFNTIKKHIFKIIFFSFVVVVVTIIYVLSVPNSYKSSVVLVSQAQTKPSIGGLGALAGLAGIDIGGSSGMGPVDSLKIIINDYDFNINLIKKYHLDKKLLLEPNFDNFVYPFGIKLFAQSKDKKTQDLTQDEIYFSTYKKIKEIISIDTDKKSGAITMSVEHPDRFLAKEILDIYLKESTIYLREKDMQNIDEKIRYYNEEIEKTTDIELKKQLNSLISSLIQKKVLAKANRYYIVKKITNSRVPYIKEKSKPKRSLIVIVAFVTSIILGIFGVFFLEFIKQEDGNK